MDPPILTQLPLLKSIPSLSSFLFILLLFIALLSPFHFLSSSLSPTFPISPIKPPFIPLLSISNTPISMDTKLKPQTLSPNTTNSNCNSPEFEFWMLRNPSFPQPNLHTADQLFVNGVILPLHLLPTTSKTDPPPQTPTSNPSSHNPVSEPDPEPDSSHPESSPVITESSSSASTFSGSKRWKDIFRKGEKNNTEDKEKEKEKEKEKKNKDKKKERKNGNGANSAAELNINIWPFSRSRSAGNTTTRPKFFTGAPVTRKVNSAPCSRSNSAGESKSRKWPSSPGRAGVHVGRNSPVWQVRRGGGKNSDQQTQQGSNTDKELKKEATVSRRSKVVSGGGGKAKVLSLNVPMCIGYRHHLSCRSDENSAIGVSGGVAVNRGGGDGGGGECHHHDEGSGGNLFNLRNLFTKKSIVTSH
ncbi:putative uncharacterized protein DDB_G0290521 [Medicago truncatula]|nr:putative uncharacterized protein DDB_G0290521 [Medicago truncatula]